MINFKIEIMTKVECLYKAELSFNILCHNPFIISVLLNLFTKYSSKSDLIKTSVIFSMLCDRMKRFGPALPCALLYSSISPASAGLSLIKIKIDVTMICCIS